MAPSLRVAKRSRLTIASGNRTTKLCVTEGDWGSVLISARHSLRPRFRSATSLREGGKAAAPQLPAKLKFDPIMSRPGNPSGFPGVFFGAGTTVHQPMILLPSLVEQLINSTCSLFRTDTSGGVPYRHPSNSMVPPFSMDIFSERPKLQASNTIPCVSFRSI